MTILDEAGVSLEAGAIGEVAIMGSNVTRGYESNPEANASAFCAGWFRTGDQGYLDEEGAVQAVADIVSDMLAPGVWHVGLFIVATARQGNGDAQVLYRSLEAWARQNGAHWMRLGVVAGNVRGQRFWDRMGFVEVRRREAVTMGRLTHTLRVMAKPVAGGSFDDYLALVPRDRPEC